MGNLVRGKWRRSVNVQRVPQCLEISAEFGTGLDVDHVTRARQLDVDDELRLKQGLSPVVCLQPIPRLGGHFRTEYQTEEGEAVRDDDKFCYVAAWEWQGDEKPYLLHKEPLEFEFVHLATRSYK
jgi:hypothetical protein